MIAVDSYIELYTQLLGWMIYYNFWSVLKVTGLVFIPFLAILLENSVGLSGAAPNRPAIVVSVLRVRKELATALVVFLLCFAPIIPLKLTMFSYEQEAQYFNKQDTPLVSAVPAVNAGNTGTVYDDKFSEVIDATNEGRVKAPVMPLLITALTKGIHKVMKKTMPNDESLRLAQSFIESAYITDQSLAGEIGRFTEECYTPARAKFFHLYGKNEPPSNIKDIMDDIPGDLDWMGSRILNISPGLYKECRTSSCINGDGFRAKTQVPGWTVSRARDGDNPAARPYCDEWWSNAGSGGSNIGLRHKLIAEADSLESDAKGINVSWWDSALITIGSLFNDSYYDGYKEDQAIQVFLSNSREQFDIASDAYAWNHVTGGANADTADQYLMYGTKSFFTFLGSIKEEIGFSIKTHALLLALPMIAAVLIFAVTSISIFIPFFMKFSLKSMVYTIFLFFSVNFLPVLWDVASFFDSWLVNLMYPESNALGAFLSPANNGGTERVLLDMATVALFIILPLLFFMLMSMAGLAVGEMASLGMAQGKSGAGSVGAQGAGSANKAANNVKGKVSKQKDDFKKAYSGKK